MADGNFRFKDVLDAAKRAESGPDLDAAIRRVIGQRATQVPQTQIRLPGGLGTSVETQTLRRQGDPSTLEGAMAQFDRAYPKATQAQRERFKYSAQAIAQGSRRHLQQLQGLPGYSDKDPLYLKTRLFLDKGLVDTTEALKEKRAQLGETLRSVSEPIVKGIEFPLKKEAGVPQAIAGPVSRFAVGASPLGAAEFANQILTDPEETVTQTWDMAQKLWQPGATAEQRVEAGLLWAGALAPFAPKVLRALKSGNKAKAVATVQEAVPNLRLSEAEAAAIVSDVEVRWRSKTPDAPVSEPEAVPGATFRPAKKAKEAEEAKAAQTVAEPKPEPKPVKKAEAVAEVYKTDTETVSQPDKPATETPVYSPEGISQKQLTEIKPYSKQHEKLVTQRASQLYNESSKYRALRDKVEEAHNAWLKSNSKDDYAKLESARKKLWNVQNKLDMQARKDVQSAIDAAKEFLKNGNNRPYAPYDNQVKPKLNVAETSRMVIGEVDGSPVWSDTHQMWKGDAPEPRKNQNIVNDTELASTTFQHMAGKTTVDVEPVGFSGEPRGLKRVLLEGTDAGTSVFGIIDANYYATARKLLGNDFTIKMSPDGMVFTFFKNGEARGVAMGILKDAEPGAGTFLKARNSPPTEPASTPAPTSIDAKIAANKARIAELEKKTQTPGMRSKQQGAAVRLTPEDFELVARRVYLAMLKGAKSVQEALNQLGLKLDRSERDQVLKMARELDADGDVPPRAWDTPDEAPKSTKPGEMPEDTAAANAVTEEVRASRDLAGHPDVDPESFQQWADEAIKQGVPEKAEAVARRVIDGKGKTDRVLTDVETAGFAIRLQQISEELAGIAKLSDDASLKRIAELDAEIDLITQASNKGGTEVARALVARRLAMTKRYEVAVVRGRYRAAMTEAGKTPDPTMLAKLDEQARQLADLEKQSLDAEARAKAALDELEALKAKKPGRSRVAKKVESWILSDAELRAAFVEVVSGPLQTVLGVGPGGGGVGALGKIAKHYVAKGVLTVDDLVQAMRSGIRQVKPDADVPEDALRKAAQEALDGSSKKSPKKEQTPEQLMEVQKKRLQKEIAGLEEELKTGQFKEPKKTSVQPDAELSELKQKAAELRAQKREASGAAEKARAKAAQKKLDELRKEVEELDRQIQNRDYNAYWKRQRAQASDEAINLRQKVADRKKFIDHQIRLAKMGKGNAIDKLRGALRTNALFNIGNRAKDVFGNVMSTGGFLGMNKLNQAIDSIAFYKLNAKGQKAIPNIKPEDVQFALRGAAKRIKQEIRDVWKYGDPDFLAKYSINVESPGFLKKMDRITGMSDIPFEDFVYRAAEHSFERDIPNVPKEVRSQMARDIAKDIVFMTDNAFADFLSGGFARIPEGAARSTAQLATDLFARFPKVLGNVMGKTTDYMYGGAKAAGQAVRHMMDGAEWTPKDRWVFSNRVARQGLGIGFVYLGKMLYDQGLLKPEDMGKYVRWNPWLEQVPGAMQIVLLGAELRHAGESASKSFSAVVDRLRDHPYFGAMRDLTYGLQSEKGLKKLGAKTTYRNLTPSQIREIARETDWLDGVIEALHLESVAKTATKKPAKKESKTPATAEGILKSLRRN